MLSGLDKKYCQKDLTKSARKPGYLCANIPPDFKLLEEAHKQCDNWQPGMDRRKDEQCGDLVPLPLPKKQ